MGVDCSIIMVFFDKNRKLSKKRLDICELCEYYNSKNKQCLKCRCFMEYKTLIPSSKCPLDKWDAINTDE